MKKFLLGILATIIAGIVLHYLTKETVDVKYSLSAPISIPSEKGYVQQLKIQNIGNATAENLIITLNGNIQNYDIRKYAEQDNYEEYDLSGRAGKQLCYPKLPKDGSIIITINIRDSDSLKVDIKHDKGNANEVFSSQSKIGFTLFFFILAIFFYLFFGVKNLIDDYWITSALQYDRKKIFTRDKPSLLSESRWKEIRKIAIENELAAVKTENCYSASDLKESKSAHYLNDGNTNNVEIEDSEKKSFIYETKQTFIKAIRNLSNSLYDKNDYADVFSIPKPKLVEESDWIKEREKIIASYELFIKNNCYNFYDISKTALFIKDALDINFISTIEREKITENIKKWWADSLEKWINGLSNYSEKLLENFIKLKQPDAFYQSEWEPLLKIAKEKYAKITMSELYNCNKDYCEKILKSKNEIAFNHSLWEQIQELAENRYCLLILKDALYTSYEKITQEYNINLINSETLNSILKMIENAKFIKKILEFSSSDIDKLPAPETIEKSLYDELIEYKMMKDVLAKKCFEIDKASIELSGKIEKVSKQLDFINTFLNNPSEIDRIEEYNDLFSKGNYRNLKRLKNLLGNTDGTEE